MKAIKENVLIETKYPGVTLGVISHSQGLLQIDAPPSPEDGRTWRASLMGLGGGRERLLVNLDAHPDRTLGARAMDCRVIAHEDTAEVFRNRPGAFKMQNDETGANWENVSGGLAGIRWVPPEIAFNDAVALQWDETRVLLETHPGPSAGAIWAVLPEEKVVFIGDAVVKNQPPFLASADIPAWLETLKLLQDKAFFDFVIIGGRDGILENEDIKKLVAYLKDAHKRLERLSRRKQKDDMTESLVQPLLSKIKFPSSRQKQYTQRLRYGLRKYYLRHYSLDSEDSE